MLNVMPPLAAGAVTVMVAVGVAHVGCVMVAVGAAGVVGCALIVTLVAGEIQPVLFLAVKLYVPGFTRLKVPVVFV